MVNFSAAKSYIIIGLFGLVFFGLAIQNFKNRGTIYHQDAAGYYLYLPSVFIYHDLDQISFHSKMDSLRDWYLIPQVNGRVLNKYPIGVAILEFPFFILAHSYVLFCSPSFLADGYSLPYQISGIVSNIFWVIVGLILLRQYLRNYFDDRLIFFSLLGLTFGTNLYYYTIYEPGMSHTYSFFLFSGVLYYTQRWYQLLRKGDLFALALCSGLILVTRPVNFPILFIPALWWLGAPNWRHYIPNIWNTHRATILQALCLFLLFPLLQLAYWRYISGSFFVDTYPNEYFDFSDPHIFQGLFSFRKGWWVYTPLVSLALIGFIPFWKSRRNLATLVLFIIALAVYITFSWKQWWYGGSFGCRPMVEYLAVLTLPFIYLLNYLFMKGNKVYSGLLVLIMVLFITLNIFQSYQYSKGILHWDRMTKIYYFKVFGKTQIDPDFYENYLIDEKEYWDEMAEISKP